MKNLRNGSTGAATAVISNLLIALLFTCIFRIPIPMAGYVGPFGNISTYNTIFFDTITSVVTAWLDGYVARPTYQKLMLKETQ